MCTIRQVTSSDLSMKFHVVSCQHHYKLAARQLFRNKLAIPNTPLGATTATQFRRPPLQSPRLLKIPLPHVGNLYRGLVQAQTSEAPLPRIANQSAQRSTTNLSMSWSRRTWPSLAFVVTRRLTSREERLNATGFHPSTEAAGQTLDPRQGTVKARSELTSICIAKSIC